MTFDWHMLYPLHTVIFDNSQVFGGVPCKAQLCNFSKWFFSPRFGVVPIGELWQFCYVRIEPPKCSGSAGLLLGAVRTCRGFGPMCFETPHHLHFTLLKILRSMCVACVLALPGWWVFSLSRESGRGLVYAYVDAALESGVYRLGLFSLGLGSRSTVPSEQPPNQQCTEAKAPLWGIQFVLNVGYKEAHLFGDNEQALTAQGGKEHQGGGCSGHDP